MGSKDSEVFARMIAGDYDELYYQGKASYKFNEVINVVEVKVYKIEEGIWFEMHDSSEGNGHYISVPLAAFSKALSFMNEDVRKSIGL